MNLVNFFINKLPNAEGLEGVISTFFRMENYPKGTHLLKPDKFSLKLMFLEKGIVRSYYEKGDRTITHLFWQENSFFGPIESLFYNAPSKYGFEVLEDATLQVIDFPDFENLLDKVPGLEKMVRLHLVHVVKHTSDKLYALQFEDAESRYKMMMEQYPDLLLRVPLGHIASYLGITQQTLSVIRARK
jgi:CRP-like cAMP-binding protein